MNKLKKDKEVCFTADYKDPDSPSFYFLNGDCVYGLEPMHLGYFEFLKELFGDGEISKITDNSKLLYRFGFRSNTDIKGVSMDTSLAGYILNPSAGGYEPLRLCDEYKVL